jgi:hypothetical protein
MTNQRVVGQHRPDIVAALLSDQPLKRVKAGPRRPARGRSIMVLIVMVALTGAVVAGNAMMNQVFPPAPAVGLIANCNPVSLSQPNVALGSSGYVLATCPGGSAAFQALSGTRVTILNFTLPAPYTLFEIYPSGSESSFRTTCTDNPAAIMLYPSVNLPIAFGYTGGWSYCLNYTDAGTSGLPTFPVGLSWGQVIA